MVLLAKNSGEQDNPDQYTEAPILSPKGCRYLSVGV